MRLFIPDIGEELKLAENWQFQTICESRNESLFVAFDIPPEDRWEKINPAHGYWRADYYKDGLDHYRPKEPGVKFEIPFGTVLKVDRVYIRKGMEDYSSITFVVVSSDDKRLVGKKQGGIAPKAVRFWVKLQETRNIEIEP